MSRYIAFDVETPNYQNDRMSAIGITVIEDGISVKPNDSNIRSTLIFLNFSVRLLKKACNAFRYCSRLLDQASRRSSTIHRIVLDYFLAAIILYGIYY